MWKVIHNAFKVGMWWTHIPRYEERAECHCIILGQIEDIDHILTKCEHPGQQEVWELARKLWEKKGGTWPYISLGLIMGAGQVLFQCQIREDALPDTGMNRLFKILISEFTYLIWLLQNERVIQNGSEKRATHHEIQN
jgi:hypothetical protein